VSFPILSILRFMRSVRIFSMFRATQQLMTLVSSTVGRAANILFVLMCLDTIIITALGVLLWAGERGAWDETRRMFLRRAGWRCPVVCDRTSTFGAFADCAAVGDTLWMEGPLRMGHAQGECVEVLVRTVATGGSMRAVATRAF
jgi:hypothetical protein